MITLFIIQKPIFIFKRRFFSPLGFILNQNLTSCLEAHSINELIVFRHFKVKVYPLISHHESELKDRAEALAEETNDYVTSVKWSKS